MMVHHFLFVSLILIQACIALNEGTSREKKEAALVYDDEAVDGDDVRIRSNFESSSDSNDEMDSSEIMDTSASDDDEDDFEVRAENLVNTVMRTRYLLLKYNIKDLDELFKAETLKKILRAADDKSDDQSSSLKTKNVDDYDDASAIDKLINKAHDAITSALQAVKENRYLEEYLEEGTVVDDGVDIHSDFLKFHSEESLVPEDLTENQKRGYELFDEAESLLKGLKPKTEAAFKLFEEAADLGNENAKLQVGWSKLFGTHTSQNVTEAKEIFEELAAKNVPFAQMAYGFLHASGIGVEANQGKALVYYTFAALGGNTWARMALGYRYWSGATVHNSCEKALDFYRLVANKVAKDVSLSGGPMIQRIRLIEEAENNGYNVGMIENDLVEYYQLLAEKGDVKAQLGLGQLHYQGGRGVPLDVQKALHYFSMAADSGNAIAMAFLGKIYLEGNDESIKQDNQTAFIYFKKAAEMNNPVGQAGLGLMYLQGQGVEKDYSKALKYFTQAADQGWVDGQLQLGVMYFNGLGTHRDYELAHKYFSQASQSGHILAFYNLAQMHATGTGTLRSCSTATELYKNVAERGKWGKKLMNAHTSYRDGYTNEAYVMYAFLAELGYEVAQSNTAFLLDRREVTLWQSEIEIYARALMYWGRAAAQGYSVAQVKLGDYHYYGLGTSVDYETAALHYRLASDQQHNAQAMFNLGYMHEQGLGMNQDLHLAKRCYDMAADTSTDAKVPAALALMKLSLSFSLKYFEEVNWLDWFGLSLGLGMDEVGFWDSYLCSVVVATVILVLYFRRFLPE